MKMMMMIMMMMIIDDDDDDDDDDRMFGVPVQCLYVCMYCELCVYMCATMRIQCSSLFFIHLLCPGLLHSSSVTRTLSVAGDLHSRLEFTNPHFARRPTNQVRIRKDFTLSHQGGGFRCSDLRMNQAGYFHCHILKTHFFISATKKYKQQIISSIALYGQIKKFLLTRKKVSPVERVLQLMSS